MTLLQSKLSARLPDYQSVLSVFAVICVVIYGWTTYSILWIFNSWLQNLNAWEIVSLISSLMVVSFLESLAAVTGILTLCMLLPEQVLKQRFVVRGCIVSLCLLLSMIVHVTLHEKGLSSGIAQLPGLWWFVTLMLTASLAWLLPMSRILRRMLHDLADRTMVFLYIFLPLTGAGVLVVLLRTFFSYLNL